MLYRWQRQPRIGYEGLFVPAVDASEAALVEDIEVYPVDTLENLVKHLTGEQAIEPYTNNFPFDEDTPTTFPVHIHDVKG